MDYEFIIAIAPMITGSLIWQVSSMHVERYLAANDEDHEAPGVMARMFVGRLFNTIPMLGRYAEFRRMQGQPPIGVWGFWGGLVLTLGGLGFFLLFISSI